MFALAGLFLVVVLAFLYEVIRRKIRLRSENKIIFITGCE